MANRNSLGRDMAFNSMGSLFYLLCQWLLTVLVVPLCSFEAAGILTLAISLTNVFFTLATFGIRIFQVSDSQGKYGPGLYISTRVLTCLFSFVLCAVFLLCNRQYTSEQVLCVLFYMLYRIGEALVDVFAGEEQRAYRFDYVGLSFLFRGIATLLSFSLTLYFTRNLTLTLLVMAVITLGVVLVYDRRQVKALTGFRLHLSLRQSLPLLREAWPLMLNSALLTLLTAVPRYFLEMYHGSELLGYFGSVSTPAVIIQAGCSFIYTPLVAPLTSRFASRDLRGFRRMLLLALGGVMGFAACMFLGAALLGRWGLTLLFGQAILPYAYLLLPVLGFTLCISLIYFLEVPLTIGRRLKVMTAIHGGAVALVSVVSLLAIPAHGLQGILLALYTGAGCDMLAMAACTVHMYRSARTSV